MAQKKVEGVCRSRFNFELDREFNSPNVIGVMKRNRLRYAGYMIKCTQVLPQRALKAVPEGRRNQRPKSRWADSRALRAVTGRTLLEIE
jgi:hypothetical protein